jgi:DNA-binding NarL/FixJ family response regulator
VVALVARHGLTNREIGRRLGLSHRTVMNYLSDLYEKTGCQCRTQLALWALHKGLVDVDEIDVGDG